MLSVFDKALYQEDDLYGNIIAERYRLTQFFSNTALSRFYRVQDLLMVSAESPSHLMVMALVNPAVSEPIFFKAIFNEILAKLKIKNSCGFYVLDYGMSENRYWYVITCHAENEFLNEVIFRAKRLGLPANNALQLCISIRDQLRYVLGEQAYGFLEPGSIVHNKTDNSCQFLNMPIFLVIQVLKKKGASFTDKKKHLFYSSYLSPEIALGNVPVHQDDTFSLAVILYQMLNGHLPFMRENTIEAALEKNTPPPVIKLSPDSWRSLQAGLSFSRKDRQDDPRQLLDQILKEPNRLIDLFKKKSQRRILAGLLALSVLGIFIGDKYLFKRYSGESEALILNQNQSSLPREKVVDTDLYNNNEILKGRENVSITYGKDNVLFFQQLRAKNRSKRTHLVHPVQED